MSQLTVVVRRLFNKHSENLFRKLLIFLPLDSALTGKNWVLKMKWLHLEVQFVAVRLINRYEVDIYSPDLKISEADGQGWQFEWSCYSLGSDVTDDNS